MSFLDRPYDSTRTARSSRDVCRDAVAIEAPMPSGHRWIVPVGLFVGLFILALLAMEKFA